MVEFKYRDNPLCEVVITAQND